jgi:hypothetical protein
MADPIAEHEALAEAAHAAERKALTALRTYQHDGPEETVSPAVVVHRTPQTTGSGGSRAKSH